MTVTVGICAYNEGLNIGPLLGNVLYEQELPAESEVLVVCSGCTDNTVDIVQEYAKKDKRVKLLIQEERSGKASAVNQVLNIAKGENILFVQADTMPHKGCFSQLISKIKDSNVGLVCAQPLPINNSKTLASRMVRILWGLHNQVFRQLDYSSQARHASEVFCVRKNITDRIPNETVNDDAYIALTARKKGWLVRYDAESQVSICGPETISDYIKQRRRVIFGHYQIKKITGESPQYFSSLIFLKWNRKMNLVRCLVSNLDLPSFMAFIWVEVMLNMIGILDFKQKKSFTIWSTATSTKKLMSLNLLKQIRD